MNSKPKLGHDDDGFLDRMANRGFALRAAAFVILFLICTNIISPLLVIHLLNEPERVTIYDDAGNIVHARLRRYDDAAGLYRVCAKEAAYALFMRNPTGTDDPDIVPLVFAGNAQKKLQDFIANESADFTRYQFHQKAELDTWHFQKTGDGTVRATTRVQLTRTGIAKERARNEVRTANLTLHMFRNRDIATNKKYPLAVWDFDVSYQQQP